ncbi:MAG: hypothetical protein SNJ71_01770 [Bacteroidales bacterium]
MAIANALTFVKRMVNDPEFRTECNTYKTKDDLLVWQKFTATEFEDAINMNLVKCQTYEEAEKYQQLKMWFWVF